MTKPATPQQEALDALAVLEAEDSALQRTIAEADAEHERLAAERHLLWYDRPAPPLRPGLPGGWVETSLEPKERKLNDEERAAAIARAEEIDDAIFEASRRKHPAVARQAALKPALVSARQRVADTTDTTPLAVAEKALASARAAHEAAVATRAQIDRDRADLINRGELALAIDLATQRRDAAVAELETRGAVAEAEAEHASAVLTATAAAGGTAEDALRAAEDALSAAERARVDARNAARVAWKAVEDQRDAVAKAFAKVAQYRDDLPTALAAVQRDAMAV